MRKLEVDEYVFSTLLRDLVGHDRQPSAFLVYLYLWYLTGSASDTVEISLKELADGTGLSRRAVQDAISRLHRRRLVSIRRDSITAIPEYRVLRPWADRTA